MPDRLDEIIKVFLENPQSALGEIESKQCTMACLQVKYPPELWNSDLMPVLAKTYIYNALLLEKLEPLATILTRHSLGIDAFFSQPLDAINAAFLLQKTIRANKLPIPIITIKKDLKANEKSNKSM